MSLNQQPTTNNQQLLIAIMGPTASGKTSLAIQLAKELNTEIISVDSRQFYKEMEIGTAKPTPQQLAEVKHHFINNLSIHQEYSAGRFARDASEKIRELFKTYKTVIAVGGSTLYYKALLEGIDDFPIITAEAKSRVGAIEKLTGLTGLQNSLKEIDPDYYADMDIENPRRVSRALEVSYSGSHPYSYYLNRRQYVPDYKIIKLGIDIKRDILYKNMDFRCDEMINNGLLNEVKELYPFCHLKPLHTVGYTEFFDYFDGKLSLKVATELFKQHTRNYAKRQMTWLRKEKDLMWFGGADLEEINRYIMK